jgi:hypothetical protein
MPNYSSLTEAWGEQYVPEPNRDSDGIPPIVYPSDNIAHGKEVQIYHDERELERTSCKDARNILKHLMECDECMEEFILLIKIADEKHKRRNKSKRKHKKRQYSNNIMNKENMRGIILVILVVIFILLIAECYLSFKKKFD